MGSGLKLIVIKLILDASMIEAHLAVTGPLTFKIEPFGFDIASYTCFLFGPFYP